MDDSSAKKNCLGFAMKAGKVVSGDFAVEKAVKSFKAKCIVIDTAASDNTKKRWQDACKPREIPIVELTEMGRAIGRDAKMVAAVLDAGFASRLIKK